MPVTDSYSIRDYGWMINDRVRTGTYVEALRRAIQPGDVVLDIGTGTGFFAFLACRFGAERVYAIEPDNSIEVAKLCSKRNPGAERITWLQGFSTEIELPERVDLIVGDLRGQLPFHTGNILSMIDARQRHLKPDGRMIPGRDVLRAAPATAPGEYECVVSPWRHNDYGVDFSDGQGFVANTMWSAKSEPIPDEALLANPGKWGVIDYLEVDSPNLEGRLEWLIDRPGLAHGIFVWFDAEVAEGLGFSNAPNLPALVYGRSFMPLAEPVELNAGDRMAAHISATLVGDEYVYRWDIRITDTSGAIKGDFKQSTFKASLPRLKDLHRTAADFVPKLTVDGEIDCAIMQAIARSKPLGEIASELVTRFPHRFADAKAALRRVADLSLKYTASE